MKAGELKHPIVFQKNTPVVNASEGVRVASWADVFTSYAKIKTLSSRIDDPGAAGGGSRSATRFEFTIRYRADINAKDYRIKYRNRIFIMDSKPINLNEENAEMVITCTEFV